MSNEEAGEAKPVPIVIPSYRRAGAVLTAQGFPTELVTLCVGEAEADEYREKNPDIEVVEHPDDVVGLAMTRQWIYDRWGTCIMLDDDVFGLVNVECPPSSPKPYKLNPEESVAVLFELADMAEKLGVYLYGVSGTTDPTNYGDHKPFRLTGLVRGGVTGLRAGAKFWWHPEVIQEDVWISALNAHFHRMALVDARHCVAEKIGGNFTNPGGLTVFRNEQTLANDKKLLQAHFGPMLGERHKMGKANARPGAKDNRTTRSGKVTDSQFSYLDPFLKATS